jgi:hypothetical protein
MNVNFQGNYLGDEVNSITKVSFILGKDLTADPFYTYNGNLAFNQI